MAMQMKESHFSHQTSLALAVKRSLRPVCLIPLTAAIFFSSYSYAIGLQEIQIKSNLGEPLNATVLLTNPPAGGLSSNCFTVLPKSNNVDFPGIAGVSTRVSMVSGGYVVNIKSSELVKEPIASITLASNCNELPIIERTYTMMIDPAGVQEERVAQAVYTPRNNTRLATNLTSNRTQTTASYVGGINNSSISQNSRYQIQRGDSLSSIAARIQKTPTNSTWSVAASILATNPSAFIDNNPDYIIQGNVLAIPSFTSEFTPNEQAALRSITNSNNSRNIASQLGAPSGVIASTFSANNTLQATPKRTSDNRALSTMTLSTSLSAVSLKRIESRANGQLVNASLLPNITNLFGSGEEENPRNPQQSSALSSKQVVEPKVIYVDRPAYPSEIDQRINIGISEGVAKAKSESSSSFNKLVTSLLASLTALGLLSWFVVRPFIKRKNRLAFIRTVRAHKKKSKYINRNKQRQSALQRLPVQKSNLSTEIEEITNTFTETSADISADTNNEKTAFELEQYERDLEAAFTSSNPIIKPSENPDSQAVINKNNGPRDSNVAQEIYEVGTIDDTGELASLTMAFPELEAELNARLGDNIPDLGKGLEAGNAETMTVQFERPLEGLVQNDETLTVKIERPFEEIVKNNETMTVQFERPLEDVVDFELPGLIDSLSNDFESIVKEDDFASTMVFNEEIFQEDDSINPFNEDTISTEGIDVNGETRVSEIMIDDDGLKASDFGLEDEDFPADKKDYSYLEPDASINSPGINLSSEELEQIGLEGDDNNIVPFSKIKQSKK